MKSWLSVVVAAVAVAQIHHHHFVVIVVVVVQSLSFHCVALVASYYSSHHRHGQYRLTMTRNVGAPTNDDDDDHHHRGRRRRRQQRYRSFVVHCVAVCRVQESGCYRHLCISVIDRLHPTTIRRRRRRWQTVNVEASTVSADIALDMLTYCIVLVQVVIVICHTRGCWASSPSSSSSMTTTRAGPCSSVLLLLVVIDRLVGALVF